LSYIGKTPTPAPLTSSDITDGIITTTKIADANVTNPKLTSGSQQNFRNIIINGDMSIAQRSTSASSITSTGYYTIDRWNWQSDYGTVTLSQDTDVPTGQGFAKSFKADVTTAGTVGSGGTVVLRQKIEGQNLQYLKKGTSSAESLTCSFWIKSTKTGTYICELFDADNTRQISKSYTVSSSNTWEKKEITFAGDTTGAFGNDNANSLQINWYLSAGSDYTSGTLSTTWTSSTNVNRAVGQVDAQDNTSNNIYLTGIQLEAGTSASDFEFLPIDVNKNRCLRYFYNHIDRPRGDAEGYFAAGYLYSGSRLYFQIPFFVEMRATPTMSAASGTDYYTFYRDSAADNFNEIITTQLRKNYAMLRAADSHISGTAGQSGGIHTTSNSIVTFSAEL